MAMLPLAGCGGGQSGVTIRGDFADSARAPASVFAVEAEREAEVKHGAFVLRDLSAGPVTLRLVRGGDTVGVLALGSLPAGTSVDLQRLAVDPATHLAFPRTIDAGGAGLVMANGVRIADDARIPAEVDTPGVVLAVSPEHDALLFRPDDGALPDLRVVIGLATEAATQDGDPVEIGRVARGDSLRVQGRADHGFVVASKLIVPRRTAVAPPTEAVAEPAAGTEARAAASPPSPPPAPVVAPVRRVVEPRIEERGRGRGGGHGRGRGKKGFF
ncbi:MAG TPA: hypothetical protein VF092_30155 [Longimicrobium sp.]